MYYNQNRRYRPNYGFNNFQQTDYRGSFQAAGGMKKKHSGAKYHATTKNGNPAISAWNYSRRHGLVSVLIAPYKGSKVVTSQSGRRWGVWMASITGKGFRQNFPVLVDLASHKAYIREGFGWVVNPSAPNGGYCGTFSRKNGR